MFECWRRRRKTKIKIEVSFREEPSQDRQIQEVMEMDRKVRRLTARLQRALKGSNRDKT